MPTAAGGTTKTKGDKNMENQFYGYNPEILAGIAQKYLIAESIFRIFCWKHQKNPDLLLNLRSEDSRILYETHYKETECTWFAFVRACDLVNAAPNTVMATVKAINRHEKRNRLPISYNNDLKNALSRFWAEKKSA